MEPAISSTFYTPSISSYAPATERNGFQLWISAELCDIQPCNANLDDRRGFDELQWNKDLWFVRSASTHSSQQLRPARDDYGRRKPSYRDNRNYRFRCKPPSLGVRPIHVSASHRDGRSHPPEWQGVNG